MSNLLGGNRSKNNTPSRNQREQSITPSEEGELVNSREQSVATETSGATMIPNTGGENTNLGDEAFEEPVDEQLPKFPPTASVLTPRQQAHFASGRQSQNAGENSQAARQPHDQRTFSSVSSYDERMSDPNVGDTVRKTTSSGRPINPPKRFGHDDGNDGKGKNRGKPQFNQLVLKGTALQKLMDFSGESTQDVDDWFDLYEACFQSGYHGDDVDRKAEDDRIVKAEKAACLFSKLRANAAALWQGLSAAQKADYEQAKTAIVDAFKDMFKVSNAKHQVHQMQQGEEETVRNFASRLQAVFMKAYGNLHEDSQKELLNEMLIEKLRRKLRVKVKENRNLWPPEDRTNWAKIVSWATSIETIQKGEEMQEMME
jgi:hypothetical protein